MTENTKKSIYENLAQAIEEIQSADWTPDGSFSIPNNNSAKDTKISYVTLRKIKHTIAPILARHGLIVVYEYDKPEWLPPATQIKPSHVLIKLTALICNGDGESVRFTTYGEGADKGEKAVSYQRAYALRSFYQDAFCISDYLEPEEVESERGLYVRQSEAVPVLMKRAVPEEKQPPQAPAPAVQGTTAVQEVSEPAKPTVSPVQAKQSAKPLSAVQLRAIENMRSTIKDKVAKGIVTEEDAVIIYDALNGITDSDMLAQFLKVKGDYYL